MNYRWLKDRKYIHSNEFVLLGRIDEEGKKFYALDYFGSFSEYNWTRRGKPAKSHEERLKALDLFLELNFTTQIESPPRVYCPTSHDVEQKVSTLIQKTTYTHVVAMDGRNRVHYINTQERLGVVHSLWTADTEVRGVNVWNNGAIVPCAMDFTGRLKSLLYHPERIVKKPVRFSWFAFDEYTLGAIREVQWDRKSYRRFKMKFMDGVVGFLEKCPICLLDKFPVECGAMCVNCYKLFMWWMQLHGSEVWIPPTRRIVEERAKGDWSPEFVNRCGVTYKGFHVITDPETGYFKFSENPQIRERYEANRLRATGLPAEQIYQWQKEQKIRKNMGEHSERLSGSTEAGSICPPAELHQQNLVEQAGE
jgi:hypothetical protein